MNDLFLIVLIGGIVLLAPSIMYFSSVWCKRNHKPKEHQYSVGSLEATLHIKGSGVIKLVFDGEVATTRYGVYSYNNILRAQTRYENWLEHNNKTGFFDSGDGSYLPTSLIESISVVQTEKIITKVY